MKRTIELEQKINSVENVLRINHLKACLNFREMAEQVVANLFPVEFQKSQKNKK